MVLVGRHSDRTGERKLHVAACAITAAAGLVLAVAFKNHLWLLVFSLHDLPDGPALGHERVLGDSADAARGRGGGSRDRDDQRDRQPRRVLRPDDDGLAARPDRRLFGRPARARRRAGDRGDTGRTLRLPAPTAQPRWRCAAPPPRCRGPERLSVHAIRSVPRRQATGGFRDTSDINDTSRISQASSPSRRCRASATPGAALDLDAAECVARHIEAGGITRYLYGGNAFLYHITLDEYEVLLGWLAAFRRRRWAIPSLGPSFGRAIDQARCSAVIRSAPR